MPDRRLYSVIALLLTVLFAPTFMATAGAADDQEGRRTGTSAADGSYAEIFGNGFSATSGQCVLYSVLTVDLTAHRQIQSGLARCDGANIDGTCHDGDAFVESIDANGMKCTPGYSFTDNTGYDATTYRTSSTSTTMDGHVNGALCPSPSHGTFDSWERYDTSSGWHFVTSSSQHRAYDLAMSGALCWATIAGVSSAGDFDVN
ncbi:MAG: hypothetical protein JWP74_2555 [Marmoricola sp.]|nr:hypothetical protein [Marmoricola sp.]